MCDWVSATLTRLWREGQYCSSSCKTIFFKKNIKLLCSIAVRLVRLDRAGEFCIISISSLYIFRIKLLVTFYYRFLYPNIKYLNLTWVRHLPDAVCCLVLIWSGLSWYPYLPSSSFGASIPVLLLQNPHLNQNQLCNLHEQIWRLLRMIHLLLLNWPSTMEVTHRNQSMLQSRVRAI